MQIGELMLMTGNQQLPTASILAQISYHGLLKKNLFPEAQQKLNIVLLQLFLLKLYGLSLFYQNYVFPFSRKPTLYFDNLGAVLLSANPVMH